MFISTFQDVIPAAKLATIQDLMSQADFVDGRISGGTSTNKNNLEMSIEDKRYVEVLRLVEAAVRDHTTFMFTAFPRFMTRPIFSKYQPGMYYREHVDFPIMNFISPQFRPVNAGLAPVGHNYVRTDLSMTVFLSAPDTYDGGELNFSGVTGPMRFKPDAGSAVLYPTGVPHQVMPVTRGSRFAAVFWIQTMFPQEAHRKVICEAHQLMQLLANAAPQASEYLQAEQLFYNLFRVLAQV